LPCRAKQFDHLRVERNLACLVAFAGDGQDPGFWQIRQGFNAQVLVPGLANSSSRMPDVTSNSRMHLRRNAFWPYRLGVYARQYMCPLSFREGTPDIHPGGRQVKALHQGSHWVGHQIPRIHQSAKQCLQNHQRLLL
jgi:hypothetical protein